MGLTCSARIYIVRARPAWFSTYTVAEFFSTALLLGPFFITVLYSAHLPPWVFWAVAAGGTSQLLTQVMKFLWLTQSETYELRGSSILLGGHLRHLFLIRLAILIIAGILIPLGAPSGLRLDLAFAFALLGEWLGRYLFFVTVVPKNMGAAFTRSTA